MSSNFYSKLVHSFIRGVREVIHEFLIKLSPFGHVCELSEAKIPERLPQ